MTSYPEIGTWIQRLKQRQNPSIRSRPRLERQLLRCSSPQNQTNQVHSALKHRMKLQWLVKASKANSKFHLIQKWLSKEYPSNLASLSNVHTAIPSRKCRIEQPGKSTCSKTSNRTFAHSKAAISKYFAVVTNDSRMNFKCIEENGFASTVNTNPLPLRKISESI